MKIEIKQGTRNALATALLATVSAGAFAQEAGAGAPDVSGIVALLVAGGAACATVGLARLTVIGGIKIYKLVARAM